MVRTAFSRFAAIACAIVVAAPAYALTLSFDGPTLTGLQELTVSGVNYDVTFADGSCRRAYATSGAKCVTGDRGFVLTTKEQATDFSQALIDQVFAESAYDVAPQDIAGCYSYADCGVLVPYDLVGLGNSIVDFAVANNTAWGDGYVSTGFESRSYYSTYWVADRTWAVASLSSNQPAAVPVPAAGLLLGGVILGGIGLGKRRKA